MTDLIDRLDEQLMDATAPDAATDEGFTIETDEQAAWVSRKLAAAHRHITQIDEWADREKERIEEVAAKERAPYQREAEWWTALLHTYLHQMLLEGRNRKTLDLPGGTLRVRKRQPAIEIHDRDAVLEALRHANPNLIRSKEDVDLTAFRKHILVEDGQVVLQDSGEVLENVSVTEQEDGVTFTPNE